MEGDEVRPGVELVQFDQLDLQRDLQPLGARQGKIRIVSQSAHAEGDGAARHFAADAAQAEDAERFVVKFDALKFLAVPVAAFHRSVRLGDFARQRHQHGEGQLGGGDGVAAGCVHHDDAALGGRLDIDVIGPHAGAAHDAEFRRGLDEVFRHFGLRTHNHRRHVAHQWQQFRFRQPLLEDRHFELGPLLEQGDSLRGDGLADQHFHKQGAHCRPRPRAGQIHKTPGGIRIMADSKWERGQPCPRVPGF